MDSSADSITVPAPPAGPAPAGPAPPPSSLADLPGPWLLKLFTSGLNHYAHQATRLALLRTCTAFRDLTWRHRRAHAGFHVPISAEAFPREAARLLAVLRRSSDVRLSFWGPCEDDDEEQPPVPWTETEPHITQLLVSAMAELGGQPLTAISDVRLRNLEQSALVPPWLRVLCPNATRLCAHNITEHLPAPPLLPAAAAAGGPTLLPHQHLAQVEWLNDNMVLSPHLPAHLWRQLASLPSLRTLAIDLPNCLTQALRYGAALTAAAHPSSSTTTAPAASTQPLLQLTALWAMGDGDDDFTDAVLQHLPQLERLQLWGFRLRNSHAHRQQCGWRELIVREVDVDSFARLPLERVRTCAWAGLDRDVRPSRDPWAVARVAVAVQRWAPGGIASSGSLEVSGADHQAVLTTLPPLLAALSPMLGSHLKEFMLTDSAPLTPGRLREVARLLPPSVTKLTLFNGEVPADAWGGLLAALPAHVEEFQLSKVAGHPSEEQVLALCRGAVRPIRVCGLKMGKAVYARVRARLLEGAGGGGRGATHPVTLVR